MVRNPSANAGYPVPWAFKESNSTEHARIYVLCVCVCAPSVRVTPIIKVSIRLNSSLKVGIPLLRQSLGSCSRLMWLLVELISSLCKILLSTLVVSWELFFCAQRPPTWFPVIWHLIKLRLHDNLLLQDWRMESYITCPSHKSDHPFILLPGSTHLIPPHSTHRFHHT